MVLVQGSSIDFLILGQSIQSFVFGKSEDDKQFYKTVEKNLKGKYLDVFVKRYDEEKILSVQGKLTEIDSSGRYLVIQSDSGERDFIYFARLEDAILAIKDQQGKLLYENANILSGAEQTIRTVPGINGLREHGRFDSSLKEGYLSISEPKPSEELRRA